MVRPSPSLVQFYSPPISVSLSLIQALSFYHISFHFPSANFHHHPLSIPLSTLRLVAAAALSLSLVCVQHRANFVTSRLGRRDKWLRPFAAAVGDFPAFRATANRFLD